MQVVILCGGKGTRLYPLTENKPKSLIEVAGKPFIEHQLTLLRKNNLINVLLCVGYLGKQIENYLGNRVKYSYDKDLGTGGALKNAEDMLDDNFMVMYGDSYLDFDYQDMIDFYNDFGGLGVMAVYKNNNKYIPSNVKVKNDLVIKYDKTAKRMTYVDYGITILNKRALKYLSIPSDLSELYQALIKEKELLAYVVGKRFYQIGDPKGLNELCLYLEPH